jgi:hypothetical protein
VRACENQTLAALHGRHAQIDCNCVPDKAAPPALYVRQRTDAAATFDAS